MTDAHSINRLKTIEDQIEATAFARYQIRVVEYTHEPSAAATGVDDISWSYLRLKWVAILDFRAMRIKVEEDMALLGVGGRFQVTIPSFISSLRNRSAS